MISVWHDGRWVSEEMEEAPASEAWGAFTTAGCDRGRPLLWDRHRRRLTATLGHLGGSVPVELPGERDLRELLGALGLQGPSRLRVVGRQLGSGSWKIEASAHRCESVGSGVTPARLEIEYWDAASIQPGHKLLARRPWDSAMARARRNGADDVLLVDDEGQVLETAVANVWCLHGETVRTPIAPTRCLPGVLREWMLENLEGAGFRVLECDLTQSEVCAADEVWLSNAVIGVRRVGHLKGLRWQRWVGFDRLLGLGIPAPGWPVVG